MIEREKKYNDDMSRNHDEYWHHDSPHNYFRRLQSYSSLGPSFSKPSSNAYTPSGGTHTRSYTRSTARTKSPELITAPDLVKSPPDHARSPMPPRTPTNTKSPANPRSLATAESPTYMMRSPTQTKTPTRVRSKAYEPYIDEPRESPESAYAPPPPVHERSESSVCLWPRNLQEPPSEVGVSEKSWASNSWVASLRSAALRHHNGLQQWRNRERWTTKRKVVVGMEFAAVVVVLIVVAVVIYLKEKPYHYDPSTVQVTNAEAFTTGGATHASPNDVRDGIGSGEDVYTYYVGGPQSFPAASQWISFEAMWQANLPSISTSCSYLGYGSDNSEAETQDMYNAIQNRANASHVDHRYILAIILQESHGCVHVHSTTSSSGVKNPGLMQSHNGVGFDSSHPSLSIMAMVQDGTQGTSSGAGLVQNLDRYGDPYSAARGYNSGYVPQDGNLSEAAGATACYVSDVANRLTGWVNAKSTCPGDDD